MTDWLAYWQEIVVLLTAVANMSLAWLVAAREHPQVNPLDADPPFTLDEV